MQSAWPFGEGLITAPPWLAALLVGGALALSLWLFLKRLRLWLRDRRDG